MRHEYYADERDITKWSILIRLAEANRLRMIYQIGMLTDDPNSSFPTRQPKAERRVSESHVMTFFKRERRDLGLVSHGRKIGRVKNLTRFLPAKLKRLKINVDESHFTNRNRSPYFDRVVAAIGKFDAVVFLDPDTGLASKVPSKQHVAANELERVFLAMTKKSVLVMYQHAQRRRRWRDNIRGRVERILPRSSVIKSVGDSAVEFYVATRRRLVWPFRT